MLLANFLRCGVGGVLRHQRADLPRDRCALRTLRSRCVRRPVIAPVRQQAGRSGNPRWSTAAHQYRPHAATGLCALSHTCRRRLGFPPPAARARRSDRGGLRHPLASQQHCIAVAALSRPGYCDVPWMEPRRQMKYPSASIPLSTGSGARPIGMASWSPSGKESRKVHPALQVPNGMLAPLLSSDTANRSLSPHWNRKRFWRRQVDLPSCTAFAERTKSRLFVAHTHMINSLRHAYGL